jgi:hypothetical protein
MFWHKKKEEPKVEVHEEEEDVSIPELDEETSQTPTPVPLQTSQPKMQLQEVSKEVSKAEALPLFVKLEKYEEIVSKIKEMRSYLDAVRQSFSLLAELEMIRNDALKIVSSTITRFERMVIEMDAELVKPGSLESEFKEPDIEHLDNALTDLQNQIKALRSELESLK